MVLKVDCSTKTIKQTMHFQNEEVLSYEISYPVFSSSVFFKSTQRLSRYYYENARSFEKYCRTALYRMACEALVAAKNQGYPMLKFEVVQVFNLTYNESCALSLYFDRYMFTGGAHGMTERFSDTWYLGGGIRRVEMEDLFADNFAYKSYVTGEINLQIAKGDKGAYFENYEQNAEECFNKNNFYLTDSELAVYFQQYDIAPYSTGIPTFLLPYEKNGAMPPKCR